MELKTSNNTTDEQATEICTKLVPQITAAWGDYYSSMFVANQAFNCLSRETRLDVSDVEPVKDCVAWLRKVYWKDDTWEGTYTGRCKEKLQYSNYNGTDDEPVGDYDYGSFYGLGLGASTSTMKQQV